MSKERDGKFHFHGYLISRLPNPVEISHYWVLKNSKYQDPEFYDILFDEYEESLFGVPPGHTKVDVIKNQYLVLLSCMFTIIERVLVCYVYFKYSFFFVGGKFAADKFKDDNLPSIKEKDRLQFTIDLVLNHMREKGKPL